MVRRMLCFLVIVSAGLGWGWAQTTAQSPVMPKKPKALMLMAAQLNGLYGINHPWHIKANFQTYDPDGKPAGQGTYEEWWAGPTKYKISYTSPHFNQTEYRNGASDVESGSSSFQPFPLLEVYYDLVQPLPEMSRIEKTKYSQMNASAGRVKMRCIQPAPLAKTFYLYAGACVKTCFVLNIPAARVVFAGNGVYSIFDKIARADGHYIADQITVYNGSLHVITANVVSLDFPTTIADSEFNPDTSTPTASLPTPPAPVVSGGRISGQYPKYPLEAKQTHVQGTVILQAWISKSGDITDLQVVSGPPELQQSAYDAVKTWKYKPYQQNGQPVKAETTISVVYTLGD